MRELNIPATVNTPSVVFDPGTQLLSIVGRCIPENPTVFFKEVYAWVEENMPSLKGVIIVDIKLEYVNSGSSKQIFAFLRLVESFHGSGERNLKVQWFYEADDEAIMDLGEDLKETVKIPMELRVI